MQSLVQTNDKAMRLSFKDALANKVKHSLTAPLPEEAKDSSIKVLFLPSNFALLSEVELHFSLLHNKELQHSRESANMAVEIVNNKMLRPKNVQFQTVELKNPVEIPQFTKNTEVKRSPGRPLTAPDSLAIKMDEDLDKRAEYKHYLATQTERIINSPVIVEIQKEITLRVPFNFSEFSQDELLYVLTRTQEFEHSRTSAYLTLDILSGKMDKPDNVILQEVVPFRPIAQPKVQPVKELSKTSTPDHVVDSERPKREAFKKALADKAELAFNAKPVLEPLVEERFVLLPEGFETMDPGELHFALIRNPEFKHTNQQAIVTADMLSGRIGTPANVVFKTLHVEGVQLAPKSGVHSPKAIPLQKEAKPLTLLTRAQLPVIDHSLVGSEGAILLPHDFESMTETQLHFALSHNREYGHSYESTYEALDIVFGRKACPKGTVFSTVQVENPIERAY